jgi:phytoene synthase
MNAERHCLELLRDRDPDRYVAALYLGRPARRAVVALYAFNSEVARIPSLVKEPEAGEVRLQWWREAVGGSRDTGGNPVAAELLAAISAHRLPQSAFERYLEARRFDLYGDAMPDRAALEGYSGDTASSLLQLACQCAGVRSPSADACGHGGVAQAATYLARAAGAHRAAGRCYIPAESLAASGLDAAAWIAGEGDQRHVAAVAGLAAFAAEHLGKARIAIRAMPRGERTALLPLAVLPALLRLVATSGDGLFAAMPDISPLRRSFAVAMAALSGKPAG